MSLRDAIYKCDISRWMRYIPMDAICHCGNVEVYATGFVGANIVRLKIVGRGLAPAEY